VGKGRDGVVKVNGAYRASQRMAGGRAKVGKVGKKGKKPQTSSIQKHCQENLKIEKKKNLRFAESQLVWSNPKEHSDPQKRKNF
jgi:hypothetical protein